MRKITFGLIAALIAVALPAAAADAPGQEAAGLHHFIGALHEHSGYSDGFPGSEPRDYFASAKGYGIDFLGSGEHSDNADVPIVASEWCIDELPVDPTMPDCAIADKDNPADSFRKWDATLEQAAAATDETFTGFRGFEWTSDRFGHINVYMSRNDSNAKVDGGYAAMDAFWEWFTRDPAVGGGADGLATFNHPGAKSLDDGDPGFNWNQFAYVPAADQRMIGLEVFNGDDEFEVKNDRGYFTQALDAGWHVGAIGAEDKGHDFTDGDGQGDDDWGGPAWPKTVVITEDNTEAEIREALVARRFYAVKDNTIRMDLRAGGLPMGSRITRDHGATLGIELDVWQEIGGLQATPQTLSQVELVSNGGEVVDSTPIIEEEGPELQFEAPLSADERYYFARVLGADGKPLATSSPVWISTETAQGGEWLAGDLHIHTTYSHDSYGGPGDDNTGPEEAYTFGHPVTSQFAVAASRGLDYLAITDHNDVRSQSDPGWQFAKDNGLVPVPGYENSLDGHAQMLGATQVYDDDSDARGVQAVADQLRADGGVFQINHPMEGDELDWALDHEVVPDTVEVWNISRLYQPPFPSASNNDAAVRFWEEFLDAGEHVGATGGADNHYVATTPVQGAGQPTTWVFAEDRSLEAILEGLREGRTFISHQPPNLQGPQIFLEGDADGDGTFESIVGDTVPAGSTLRVRVVNAPGSLVRLYKDGGEKFTLDKTVDGPDFVFELPAPENATWVRAEIAQEDLRAERVATCDQVIGGESTYCRNNLLVLAMTSAIYLSGGNSGPAPVAFN